MPRLDKILGSCGAAVVALGAVVATAAPAQAAVTICNSNTSWYEITSRSSYDQVDPGDLLVHRAPATASMSVTRDFTTSATTAASASTTSGTSISASAGVAAFNASAGYSTGTEQAMEVSNTVSRTVSQNVVVPAGQSFVQFVGHRVTNANMQHRYCNSTGTAISTTWRGTVFGPQYPVAGFEDCRYTTLC